MLESHRIAMHKRTIANIASTSLKRAIDLFGATLGIVIALPVLAFLIVAINAESRGNPIFLQTRIGRNGRPYTLIKLRSLYVENFGFFGDCEIPCNDSRVTRVGRILRRTKIDEIPQLLNVIVGHMSLVGPRPDIPEQVKDYTDEQRQRLLLRPGLTGVAQISGNTHLPWEARIILDLWYIRNRSLFLDIKIILLTLQSIIKGETSSNDPLGLYRLFSDASE